MLKKFNRSLPNVVGGKSINSFKPKHIYNGYIILKSITIPSGLYGANSAVFFLEKGVSFPKGELGHSRLYDFNTMSCYGINCLQ